MKGKVTAQDGVEKVLKRDGLYVGRRRLTSCHKGRPKRTFMDVGNEDMKLTGAPEDDGSG